MNDLPIPAPMKRHPAPSAWRLAVCALASTAALGATGVQAAETKSSGSTASQTKNKNDKTTKSTGAVAAPTAKTTAPANASPSIPAATGMPSSKLPDLPGGLSMPATTQPSDTVPPSDTGWKAGKEVWRDSDTPQSTPGAINQSPPAQTVPQLRYSWNPKERPANESPAAAPKD